MDTNYYLEKLSIDMQLRGFSPSTQRDYHQAVNKFLEFCDAPVEQLTELDVRSFIMKCGERRKFENK